MSKGNRNRSRRLQAGDMILTEVGPTIEVTPEAQMAGRTRLDAAMAKGARDGSHVWTAIVQYLIADPAATLHLDNESIAAPPMLLCFLCEEPYSTALAAARCKGEPPQWMPVPR